jgi:hypothetical protein
MKQKITNINAQFARAVFAASVAVLAALPGHGQQAGTNPQTGAGSAGTTTGGATGTGTIGTAVEPAGSQGNTRTPRVETGTAPVGSGTRQPIPAGSSPPSNTTITNPTGTYDRGGNPTLSAPVGTGTNGTVPAYDANPNTTPPGNPPANPTNDVRNNGSMNNRDTPNNPSNPNDTRSTSPTGAGANTTGRDYD